MVRALLIAAAPAVILMIAGGFFACLDWRHAQFDLPDGPLPSARGEGETSPSPTCDLAGCDNPYRAQGLCEYHLARARRGEML